MIEFLKQVFRDNAAATAIVWRDRSYDYGWLLAETEEWGRRLGREGIEPGAVVIVEADFSPASVALLLALVERRTILVPLTSSVEAKKPELIETAEGEISITVEGDEGATVRHLGRPATHEFHRRLRDLDHPGLVLFSSGSTGKSKGAVHDMTGLLEKFKVPRQSLRTIAFLLYDHIGGVNTLLYTLSNVGCLVTVADRSPDAVLEAIERHRVELLPTSPTFVNLILLSEAHTRHDLGCLRTVTYGTEPMPESTLKRFHEAFPHIRLQQTYGLSEVGILRSKSRSSDSLWVKVGGEGFETRVVDGILQIKAQSAMLGYLNAPSPFTADGWFDTGDEVEVDGEYLRILGRRSEMINVGGEKVYPAEVEGVIQELDNVADVTVYGEPSAVTGKIVCARVKLRGPEGLREVTLRIRRHCRGRLEPYKVPVKVAIVEEATHSPRFKKMR